jgi:hypothetical protein
MLTQILIQLLLICCYSCIRFANLGGRNILWLAYFFFTFFLSFCSVFNQIDDVYRRRQTTQDTPHPPHPHPHMVKWEKSTSEAKPFLQTKCFGHNDPNQTLSTFRRFSIVWYCGSTVTILVLFSKYF